MSTSKLTNYFTKVENFLDTSVDIVPKLKLGKLITSFAGTGTLLEYFVIENLDDVLSLHTRSFCKIKPNYIIYSQITGSGLLGAHIDHGPLVNLNVYLSAEKDRTCFYEKNSNVSGTAYPGRDQSNIFDASKLNQIGHFIAKSNESYLLNVSEIHSVYKISTSKRSFITYSWHEHSYQEVLDNLC